MSTVNIKYLKDESGNVISPITSIKSIYNGDVTIEDFMCGNVLWAASINNPSTVTSIELSDSRKNYKRLIVYYKNFISSDQKSVIVETGLTDYICCDGMVFNGQLNTWNYMTSYHFDTDTRIVKMCAVNLSRNYATGNFEGQTKNADMVIPLKIVGYKY